MAVTAILLFFACFLGVSRQDDSSKSRRDSRIVTMASGPREFREKRQDLDGQRLFFKLKIVIDSEAVRLARIHFEEAQANKVLNEISIIFGQFIDGCFESLRPEVNIRCHVTQIRIFEKPIPEVAEMPHRPTSDGRLTVCARSMFKVLETFVLSSDEADHTLFLTGMGVLFDSTHDTDSFVYTGMMSSTFKSLYTAGSNSMSYSKETRKQLQEYLISVAREIRSGKCLKEIEEQMITPHVDIGARLNHDKQCKISALMNAANDQNIKTICSEGIICINWRARLQKRILPFPGTPCSENDATKMCRWNRCL